MSEGDAESGTAGSAGPDVSRMRRHESDHEIPWALPMVVRRSKTHVARHVDVLEAAAEAVVTFLDDPRSQPDGEWHEAVEHWRHGAIRKVVRRGDGKQFEDAALLGSVRVQRESAFDFGPVDVLVLPPGPVQPLPRELKKLQVGGTEFPHGVSDSDGGSYQPGTTASVTPKTRSSSSSCRPRRASRRARRRRSAVMRRSWRTSRCRRQRARSGALRTSASAWSSRPRHPGRVLLPRRCVWSTRDSRKSTAPRRPHAHDGPSADPV